MLFNFIAMHFIATSISVFAWLKFHFEKKNKLNLSVKTYKQMTVSELIVNEANDMHVFSEKTHNRKADNIIAQAIQVYCPLEIQY